MDISHLWTSLLSAALGAGGARFVPPLVVRMNGNGNGHRKPCDGRDAVEAKVMPVLERLASVAEQNTKALNMLTDIAQRQERREERREDLRAAIAEQRAT
jgi:hypothetical protein